MPAPTGPQFITVYHASNEEQPPHKVTRSMLEDKGHRYIPEDYENTDFNVIHAGTMEAASAGHLAFRDFVHEYQIPKTHEYPVTFGDSPEHLPSEETYDSGAFKEFNKNMKGVQEGLFETVSGTPQFAIKTNQAVPYRNTAESPGSISYMIPKKAINDSGIIYKGYTGR